uniref:Uncharacterized protein n=1 Tax=Plectus sambesii TaxID=2011161 RepID=A0A914UHX3_9BILA
MDEEPVADVGIVRRRQQYGEQRSANDAERQMLVNSTASTTSTTGVEIFISVDRLDCAVVRLESNRMHSSMAVREAFGRMHRAGAPLVPPPHSPRSVLYPSSLLGCSLIVAFCTRVEQRKAAGPGVGSRAPRRQLRPMVGAAAAATAAAADSRAHRPLPPLAIGQSLSADAVDLKAISARLRARPCLVSALSGAFGRRDPVGGATASGAQERLA